MFFGLISYSLRSSYLQSYWYKEKTDIQMDIRYSLVRVTGLELLDDSVSL